MKQTEYEYTKKLLKDFAITCDEIQKQKKIVYDIRRNMKVPVWKICLEYDILDTMFERKKMLQDKLKIHGEYIDYFYPNDMYLNIDLGIIS